MSDYEERFWSKVDRRGAGECWPWQAGTNRGYGAFSLGRRSEGMALAHRVSWQLANGDLPEGKFVRHKCDNPPCVNPAHLELGDQTDNMRDMAERERGHHRKLTAAQVSVIRARLRAGSSQRELACEFGVTQGTVSWIAQGKTWRHVA